MEIIVTKEFKNRYSLLPVSIQRKAKKQELLFRENPFYSSLHTEKLEPRRNDIWSLRIDRNYRIIFRFINGQTVLFLTVGRHDWIYRLRF